MTVWTVWYILFFILWQFERCGIFCFSLYDSSNGVVYCVFHLMTVRTEWSILFFIFMTVRTVWHIFLFILWQFERCGIFCFSFYDSLNGVVYFVFHFYNSSNVVAYFSFYFMTVRTVWYILFFILWQFERSGIFCFSFYYYFADDEVMIRV